MQISPYLSLIIILMAVIIKCLYDSRIYIRHWRERRSSLPSADNTPSGESVWNNSSLTALGDTGQFSKKGINEIIAALVLCFFSLLFFGLSLFVLSDARFFLHELKFIPFSFIPLIMLLFYMQLTNKRHSLKRWALVLLIAFPVISITLILTNNFHHAFRLVMQTVNYNGVSYINPISSWWYPIMYTYNYGIYLLGSYFLTSDYFNKPVVYRSHHKYIVLSNTLLLFISLLSVLRIVNDYGDMALIAFCLSIIVQYKVIAGQEDEPAVRKLRGLLVVHNDNPVIIFDNKDILIDANESAVKLMSALLPDSKAFAIDYAEFKSAVFGSSMDLSDGGEIYFDHNKRYYSIIMKDIDLTKNHDLTWTAANNRQKRILPGVTGLVGRIVVLNDVTLLRTSLTELEHITTHDYLTNLINRTAFRKYLVGIRADDLPVAFIFINISGMKLINDIFGDEFGDNIIKSTAEILLDCSRGRSTGAPARLGGDEFAVALRATDHGEACRFTRMLEERVFKECSDRYHVLITTAIVCANTVSKISWQTINNALASLHTKRPIMPNGDEYSQIKSLRRTPMTFTAEELTRHVRISAITAALGDELGLSHEESGRLTLLSNFHDIGLLSISRELLAKKNSLSNDQWEEYKLHTIKGYNIAMCIPEMASIAIDIRAHHERYDGYGYPDRLTAEDIPLLARILSVAEAASEYEAQEQAIDTLLKSSGKRFDPNIVHAYKKIYGA